VIANLTVTHDLTINNATVSLTGGNIFTQGNLSFGNTTLLLDGNSFINTSGCLNIVSDTNVVVNVSKEDKQKYGNGGKKDLFVFQCANGLDKLHFQNLATCVNDGVNESVNVGENSITLIFGTCFPIGIIIAVAIIVGLFVIFLIVVFTTKLKYKLFPFLGKARKTRNTLRKKSMEMKRKSELNIVESRLSTLQTEISVIDNDSKRLTMMIDDMEKGKEMLQL